jgi:phage FluMu protein Com
MGRVENKVVTVECSICHKPFERSHFNPYMDKCPACRKSQSKQSIGRSEKSQIGRAHV